MVFGFYAVFISPQLAKTMTFNEQNLLIAYLGFAMLLFEPFALLNKLKNARIRSALKREHLKQTTGNDKLPTVGKLVMFGFFARLLLRATAVSVCTTALGFPPDLPRNKENPVAVLILLSFIFYDICWLAYIYMKTEFFNDHHYSEKELILAKEEYEKWNEKHLDEYFTPKSYWKEFIADGVLQVYAIMLITAFIDYFTTYGLKQVKAMEKAGYAPWDAAADQAFMFFFMLVGGLMPVRIGYWLEDSLMTFSKRERVGQLLMFLVIMFFCFIPGYITYEIHFGEHTGSVVRFLSSVWANLLIALTYLIIMTVLRYFWYNPDQK